MRLVGDARTDMRQQGIGVAQCPVEAVFQIHLDNMRLVYALLQQVVVKQREEQVRLAAPAHPRHHFYHVVAAGVNEFLQVIISPYLHNQNVLAVIFMYLHIFFGCKDTAFLPNIQALGI